MRIKGGRATIRTLDIRCDVRASEEEIWQENPPAKRPSPLKATGPDPGPDPSRFLDAEIIELFGEACVPYAKPKGRPLSESEDPSPRMQLGIRAYEELALNA